MALAGVRVIEMAGLAPAPFCGLILADFGCRVIRIDRASGHFNIRGSESDRLALGKQSISVDLKKPQGINIVKKLTQSADVIIEPFRKGVMEKLNLGPDELLKNNPRLIYARLTGYGQDGPMAERAGHDINYLAISGLLSRFARADGKPNFPVNLLADFAGGGLICALGIVMALYQRQQTGRGQVIDANMVEGASYIGSFLWRLIGTPILQDEPGHGWLDGGQHFYDTYRTKDDRFMSVGAIEPQFYALLIKGLGLSNDEAPQFGDPEELRNKFAKIFASKTQAEWCAIFDNTDACVAPVVPLQEAHNYPHNKIRKSFVPSDKEESRLLPRPAPRLSAVEPGRKEELRPQPKVGEHTESVLHELGYSKKEIQDFITSGIVEQASSSKL